MFWKDLNFIPSPNSSQEGCDIFVCIFTLFERCFLTWLKVVILCTFKLQCSSLGITGSPKWFNFQTSTLNVCFASMTFFSRSLVLERYTASAPNPAPPLNHYCIATEQISPWKVLCLKTWNLKLQNDYFL